MITKIQVAIYLHLQRDNKNVFLIKLLRAKPSLDLDSLKQR